MLKLLDMFKNVFTCDADEDVLIETVPFNRHISVYKERARLAPTILIVPSALHLLKRGPQPIVEDANVFYVAYSDHSCRSEIISFLKLLPPIYHIEPIVKGVKTDELRDFVAARLPR